MVREGSSCVAPHQDRVAGLGEREGQHAALAGPCPQAPRLRRRSGSHRDLAGRSSSGCRVRTRTRDARWGTSSTMRTGRAASTRPRQISRNVTGVPGSSGAAGAGSLRPRVRSGSTRSRNASRIRSAAQSRSSCVTLSGGARRTVVCVGVLGQHAHLHEALAHRTGGRRLGRELDADPQSYAADLRHGLDGGLGAQPLDQRRAQLIGAPLVLAGAQQPQHLQAHRARERVAAERGPVLAGPEHAQHVAGGHDGADGHDPAPQRLAQHEHVGLHAFVLARERAAGAAQARLDLVGDQQHPVLGAQLARTAQVAVGRHDDAGLALDRLHQEPHHVGVGERGLERIGVAVGHGLEPRRERPEPAARVRVGGEAHDRDRAAVEVAAAGDDLRPAFGDALDVVAPAARGLQRGLDGLGPGVHRAAPSPCRTARPTPGRTAPAGRCGRRAR